MIKILGKVIVMSQEKTLKAVNYLLGIRFFAQGRADDFSDVHAQVRVLFLLEGAEIRLVEAVLLHFRIVAEF
jgi:hypothetical protein